MGPRSIIRRTFTKIPSGCWRSPTEILRWRTESSARASIAWPGWCAAEGEGAIAWQTSARACPPHAGLIVTAPLGAGRIAVVNDSVLFGDERLGDFQHEQLWLNLLYWLAAPAVALRSSQIAVPPATPDAWTRLKDAVNELRRLQTADGSVPLAEQPHAARLVEEVLANLKELGHSFRIRRGIFCRAASRDFRAWIDAGFGRPDFRRLARGVSTSSANVATAASTSSSSHSIRPMLRATPVSRH